MNYFKAKRLDNGQWVYGYYVKSNRSNEKETHYIFTGRCELIYG